MAVSGSGMFAGTEFKEEDTSGGGPDILKGRASYADKKETAKMGAALLKQSMGAVGDAHVKS